MICQNFSWYATLAPHQTGQDNLSATPEGSCCSARRFIKSQQTGSKAGKEANSLQTALAICAPVRFCSGPVEVVGGLSSTRGGGGVIAFEGTLQERRELNLLYMWFWGKKVIIRSRDLDCLAYPLNFNPQYPFILVTSAVFFNVFFPRGHLRFRMNCTLMLFFLLVLCL